MGEVPDGPDIRVVVRIGRIIIAGISMFQHSQCISQLINSSIIGGKSITLHISKKEMVISIFQPYKMWGTLVKWWGASQVGPGIRSQTFSLSFTILGGFL